MKIGKREIATGKPCYVIAEIGINHNGELGQALELMRVAADAGCDAVKFQKRTIDVVYSAEELARPRESPYGSTNGELKRGLEFGQREYREIDQYSKQLEIHWFASAWDIGSLAFLEAFNPPCHKVASAMLTDREMLAALRETRRPILLSTGMSDQDQIDRAVRMLDHDLLALLHCVSVYPCEDQNINLQCLRWLRRRYDLPIGYSGHERGIATTVAAVALGACVVERHITLDRTMWGSDQAASLEPQGLRRLVRDIRAVERAMGDGKKRILDGEREACLKLRRRETV